MSLYFILTFLIQLVLFPLFLRVVLYFHQVERQDRLCDAVFSLTDAVVLPVFKRLPRHRWIDVEGWSSIGLYLLVVTSLKLFFLSNWSLGSVVFSMLLESLNRITSIYIFAGLLAHFGHVVREQSLRPFVMLCHRLVYEQHRIVTIILKSFVLTRSMVRFSFWVWLILVLWFNIKLEQQLLALLY